MGNDQLNNPGVSRHARLNILCALCLGVALSTGCERSAGPGPSGERDEANPADDPAEHDAAPPHEDSDAGSAFMPAMEAGTAEQDADGTDVGPTDGADAGAADAMQSDASRAPEAGSAALPPKTHAELCPNATPGVGMPVPTSGAPMELGRLVGFVESDHAEPQDFGVSLSAQRIQLIENQPGPITVSFTAGFSSRQSFSARSSAEWPSWLQYAHDPIERLHVFTIEAGQLRRGTYLVHVPLWDYSYVSAPVAVEVWLDLIIQVRGLGFVSDRLSVPHYVGDPLGTALPLTLAGGASAWRITDIPPWLRVSQSAGDTLGAVDLKLVRQAPLDTLQPGTYTGRLCVENQRGDAASIPVYAVVERPGFAPLHTHRILYSFASTEQLSSYNYIFTPLRQQARWQATSSAAWLIPSSLTGITGERVGFRVDPSGLPDGEHSGTLSFADATGQHEGTRFVVTFIKDARLARWSFNSAIRQDAVSPVSPHAFWIGDTSVAVIDVFGGSDKVIRFDGRRAQSAVLSQHSSRLYLLTTSLDFTAHRIDTYSWPELQPLGGPSTDRAPFGEGEALFVLGREYLHVQGSLWNVTDGRRGPVLDRVGRNRARLRVYDDGTMLFGFWEDLNEPLPSGIVHWARGPNATCTFQGSSEESIFECSDPAGVYLRFRPDPQPDVPLRARTPIFTHQGGIYFSYPDGPLACTASGAPITMPPRNPPNGTAKVWGDTILIADLTAEALNYLFEPRPPPVESPAPAPSHAVCPAPPGTVIAKLALTAAALVADPLRNRLYAVVSSGPHARELVTLDGSSGAILQSVALDGTPSMAAIAHDGQVLWVVLGEPNRLQTIDLSNDTPIAGSTMLLPTDSTLYPAAMAAAAGRSDTVAVALEGFLGGVALYMGGVLRDYTPFNALHLVAGPFGQFYAAERTWSVTRVLRVSDRHIDPVERIAAAVPLAYQQGTLFVRSATGVGAMDVRDPAHPTDLAPLEPAASYLPDLANQRVWALRAADGPQAGVELRAYNPTTWTSTTQHYAEAPSTSLEALVRSAGGCLAYISRSSQEAQVVLLAPPR